MSAKPIKWKAAQYGTSQNGYIEGVKVAVLGESVIRGEEGFSVWVIGYGNSEGRFPIKDAKAKAQRAVDALVEKLSLGRIE